MGHPIYHKHGLPRSIIFNTQGARVFPASFLYYKLPNFRTKAFSTSLLFLMIKLWKTLPAFVFVFKLFNILVMAWTEEKYYKGRKKLFRTI
jgi:hypothetical protein